MNQLPHPEQQHLDAAEGWLELGDVVEAGAALQRIPLPLQHHPQVLNVRWHLCAKTGDWEAALDIGAALIQIAPESELG